MVSGFSVTSPRQTVKQSVMTSTSIDFGLTLAHSAKQENPLE